ncbi:MAG: two-component sensor histidine kinase [Rhodobacteraceae bacterium]|nr:two-component sensor histidine kinase [Paracoccaceae bacterium]
MLISAVIIGNWVSGRIEDIVVRNAANATSQYMESFIAPLSQDLATGDTLSPGARRALEEVFVDTPLGERVISYKLWNREGLVVEASDKSLVGQRFDVTEGLAAALAGEVQAEFEGHERAENAGENALGIPLLEIYSPLREVWSGQIIGVAEFYEVATGLQRDLVDARRKSWLAVVAVFATIGASLYLIVRRGSRTIDRQIEELATLSDHNAGLRRRVLQAASRTSAMNEQVLRRIGADLHDGPAQQLGYAALRLDSLRGAVKDPAELDAVARAIKDALGEMRHMSRGLSLPDIETRDPCDIIRGVVDAHVARFGADVAVDCHVPDGTVLPSAIKICLYRFVQEGLNNAWRYAGGAGVAVRLDCADEMLELLVRDQGPGFPPATAAKAASEDNMHGLGLNGLRDRVESIGGTFEARNRNDGPGAEVRMVVDMKAL